MEKFYSRLGIDTSRKSTFRHEIPEYKTSYSVKTSDTICSNGLRKETQMYTGNEIAGIVTTHKSNLMPIRKDNPQAAIDAANMRR